MFEHIGRTRDEAEVRRRRAVALGIFSSAVAFVGVLILVIPWPEPPVVPNAPVALLPPLDQPEPEIEQAAPIYQAPAPAGRGEADPIEQAEPYKTPTLSAVVDTRVANATDPGRGTEKGPGVGPGGNGTSSAPCPVDADCSGGGPIRLHHTQLEIDHAVDPSYPAAARAMNLGDERCLAAIAIDRQGRVYEVRISECSPAFHRAVERALLKWRFVPVTTETGTPVEARTRIAVRFRRGSR